MPFQRVSQPGGLTPLAYVLRAHMAANLRDFGAVGDGVNDDRDALLQAVDSISGPQGGVVFVPRGVYGLTAAVTIPTNVTLVGEGARASRFLALPSWSGDPLMLQLGAAGSRAFNCGLVGLMVDANHIVGTGVFSGTINEQCVIDQVLVRNFAAIGVDITSQVIGSNGQAQNFDISNLECYASVAAAVNPIGLQLTSTAATKDFARSVRSVTVNSSDGTTTITGGRGIVVNGYQGTTIQGVHVERMDTGVHIGANNASHGTTVLGFWGSSTLTDCVRIEVNAGDGITVLGVIPAGAPNVLVDVLRGITLTSAQESRLGFYAVGTGNAIATSSGVLTSQLAALRVLGKVGFFNTAPATRQSVTGSRGGNAALASLLTALATYGLITDNTTP